MTPRAFVLQTQDDAPAGLLATWAERRGIALDVVRVDRDELPEPCGAAFAVVLGSGATATGGGPPWVEATIEWVRAADAAALPVLGICFGAQVLAFALGGCVHRLPAPEVGWVTVETADADHVPPGPWLAWHEDGITSLPPLAYELARNAFGVQAFCHTRHLAVQFHPEVTPAIVAAWADQDHGDLERAGTDRGTLDAGTAAYGARAAEAAETLFDGFAARAGLVAVASRV